jgi:Mini-chromosome maintenance protein 2
MPGLDRYDPNMLDEDDYDAMSPGTRAAVEQELRRRDRDLGGRRGLEYGKFLLLHFVKLIFIVTV